MCVCVCVGGGVYAYFVNINVLRMKAFYYFCCVKTKDTRDMYLKVSDSDSIS